MTTIKKLSAMPYAQAYVHIYDDGTIVLVSYNTAVIFLTPDGWCECTGTYSQTTRRHINRFMAEYVPIFSYQTMRDAYKGNYRINRFTNEIDFL